MNGGAILSHVIHRTMPWMAATLDGLVKETGAVFEAKFVLPWSFSEEAAENRQDEMSPRMRGLIAGLYEDWIAATPLPRASLRSATNARSGLVRCTT
jgi:hypothetical protein